MVTAIRKIFNKTFSREFMQITLLKNLVSSFIGQQASSIIDFLHDKKNVNEYLIAKKLKLTINQTRNILYKLADEGIVSFIRRKDKKKGGWYIYFWTLNTTKGLARLKENLLKGIKNLKNKLELKKKERFYQCASCMLEANEENALVYQYTCTECGEILQLKDKGKEIESIGKEIAKLEGLLKSTEDELSIISKKDEILKLRKLKSEVKKKSKERAIKKKKKERELRKIKKMKKNKRKKHRKGRKTITFKKFGGKLVKLFRRK